MNYVVLMPNSGPLHIYVAIYALTSLFKEVASEEESRLLIGWMALRRLRLKQINKSISTNQYSKRRSQVILIQDLLLAILILL